MTDSNDKLTRQPTRRRGRPRKSPEDLVARNQLIKTGLAYLTERGFSDVSVDEILKASSATKGNFYYHFKSKSDFAQVLVETYHQYFADKLIHWFANEELLPLDRLRYFVEDAERGMAKYEFSRGCLIGNLGQEMASLPPELGQKLISVLESWQSLTAVCLKQAQDQQQISPEHDTQYLAEFFWIGWEGAVLRAKLERKPDPLRSFAKGFFTLASTLRNPKCTMPY